ncbi:MAG: hypothetical protein R3E01_15870 [Pirellulaceae bacterium]|nr:hypothetical protein [Planctomycetales bacterium]
MYIRWSTSPFASVLYAARQLTRVGHDLTNRQQYASLTPFAAELARQLDESPSLGGWEVAMTVAVQHHDLETCYVAVADALTERCPANRTRILEILRSLTDQAQQLFPSLQEELRLRVGPLRLQWEARGPGLLRMVMYWGRHELSPTSHVAAVLPVDAGGGVVIGSQLVAIEAVLANPQERMPEVLRLGWLLSQLVPHDRWSGAGVNYHPGESPCNRLWSLALIPAILAAGERLELCECTERSVHDAVQFWLPPDERKATIADCLWAWWTSGANMESGRLTSLDKLQSLLKAQWQQLTA